MVIINGKNSWYNYTIEGRNTTSFNVDLCVPDSGDILDVGIRYLQDLMFWEKASHPRRSAENQLIKNNHITQEDLQNVTEISQLQDIVVPLYLVYNRYTITGIVRTKNCEGCRIESPGQIAHMECPDGCLHIGEYCQTR